MTHVFSPFADDRQLFTITSSTISYLSTSTNFKPLHPDLPVTFRSTSADPMVVFNGSFYSYFLSPSSLFFFSSFNAFLSLADKHKGGGEG